jgi:hypothetical protein
LQPCQPSCRNWTSCDVGVDAEGPTADAEGNVYFTDILMQRIMRFKGRKFSIFVRRATSRTGWSSTRRTTYRRSAVSPTAERYGMTTGGIPRDAPTFKTGKVESSQTAYAGKPRRVPVTSPSTRRAGSTSDSTGGRYRIDAPGKMPASSRLQTSSGRTASSLTRRSNPLPRRSQWRPGWRAIRAYDLLRRHAEGMRVLYNLSDEAPTG